MQPGTQLHDRNRIGRAGSIEKELPQVAAVVEGASMKRKQSYQDLVEVHPSLEHEFTLFRPNCPKVHPTAFQSFCTTHVLLFVFWIFVLISGEYLIFHYSMASCAFPVLSNDEDTIHLALIGDPQLTDRYSYKWLTASGFLLPKIVEFYSDIYMRKNFQLLQLYQNPSAIFVMGDLFDSAKVLTDKEFKKEYARYKWVFEDVVGIRQFNLSGNHDIGYDIDPVHQLELANRFKEYFGELNYGVTIKGVNFAVISATTAEESTSNKELYQETDSFIRSLDSTNSNNALPSVLFHHIPLWRAEGTRCGSLRTRNAFMKDHAGYSYRNMLDKTVSEKILGLIRPFLTFSGDDHDYCKIKHSNYTTEHTIGTFSWLQGNPYPSVALVSIKGNSQQHTMKEWEPEAEVSICFLPNQRRIYIFYVVLIIISLVLVAFNPLDPDRRKQSILVLSKYSEMVRLFVFRMRNAVQKVFVHATYLFLFYLFLVWLAI